jgi:recombination protein RecR
LKSLPPTLNKVIEAFTRFPGIGNKTAHRLGLHVLKSNNQAIEEFAQALLDLKNNIRTCQICHNFSEADKCGICSDVKREKGIICVCEEPSDIFLLEKTGYQGVYHVLGGLISPLDGIGPEELNMDSLTDRAASISELIIATDASVEGDTTALYISKILDQMEIKITRLSRGLPVGGHLEYVDEATLAKSIHERVEINSTE